MVDDEAALSASRKYEGFVVVDERRQDLVCAVAFCGGDRTAIRRFDALAGLNIDNPLDPRIQRAGSIRSTSGS